MKIDRVSLDILRTGSVINARMKGAYSGTLTINVGGIESYFFSHADTMDDNLRELLLAYERFVPAEDRLPTP